MFFCLGTDIPMTVTPIGMKFCMMVELCPRCSVCPFNGDIFKSLQMWGQKGDHFNPLNTDVFCLTANIAKTISWNITWQLELNISSTGAF